MNFKECLRTLKQLAARECRLPVSIDRSLQALEIVDDLDSDSDFAFGSFERERHLADRLLSLRSMPVPPTLTGLEEDSDFSDDSFETARRYAQLLNKLQTNLPGKFSRRLSRLCAVYGVPTPNELEGDLVFLNSPLEMERRYTRILSELQAILPDEPRNFVSALYPVYGLPPFDDLERESHLAERRRHVQELLTSGQDTKNRPLRDETGLREFSNPGTAPAKDSARKPQTKSAAPQGRDHDPKASQEGSRQEEAPTVTSQKLQFPQEQAVPTLKLGHDQALRPQPPADQKVPGHPLEPVKIEVTARAETPSQLLQAQVLSAVEPGNSKSEDQQPAEHWLVKSELFQPFKNGPESLSAAEICQTTIQQAAVLVADGIGPDLQKKNSHTGEHEGAQQQHPSGVAEASTDSPDALAFTDLAPATGESAQPLLPTDNLAADITLPLVKDPSEHLAERASAPATMIAEKAQSESATANETGEQATTPTPEVQGQPRRKSQEKNWCHPDRGNPPKGYLSVTLTLDKHEIYETPKATNHDHPCRSRPTTETSGQIPQPPEGNRTEAAEMPEAPEKHLTLLQILAETFTGKSDIRIFKQLWLRNLGKKRPKLFICGNRRTHYMVFIRKDFEHKVEEWKTKLEGIKAREREKLQTTIQQK